MVATVRKYQFDTFSVIVLIVAIITAIYTIVCAVYYYRLTTGVVAGNGEYTFLFWISLVVGLIILILTIISIIRIFTYKVEIPDSCASEFGLTPDVLPLSSVSSVPTVPNIPYIQPIAPAQFATNQQLIPQQIQPYPGPIQPYPTVPQFGVPLQPGTQKRFLHQ